MPTPLRRLPNDPVIHVAITCASNSPATGRFCPAIEDNIPLGDVGAWHAAALGDRGWTVDDDGNTWCPRHNPGDVGAAVRLTSGEYRPLGDSGWEARLPDAYGVSSAELSIEIRQRRDGDVTTQPPFHAVVADREGWRWKREHALDPDVQWVHRHHEGSESVSWDTLLTRGPLKLAEADLDVG